MIGISFVMMIFMKITMLITEMCYCYNYEDHYEFSCDDYDDDYKNIWYSYDYDNLYKLNCDDYDDIDYRVGRSYD